MSRRMSVIVVALLLTAAACGGSSDDGDAETAAPSQAPAESEAATEPEADTAAPAAPDTTAPASSVEDEGSEAAEGGSGSGGGGDIGVPAGDTTVEVNGESLPAHTLLRCIPFSESADELDLQVVGDGYVLFINTTEGSLDLSIQGRAVGDGESMGVFGATAFDLGGEWTDAEGETLAAPPVDWTGDRVSGSMTLADSFGGDGTVDVSFDAEVPADVIDCNL